MNNDLSKTIIEASKKVSLEALGLYVIILDKFNELDKVHIMDVLISANIEYQHFLILMEELESNHLAYLGENEETGLICL